MAPDFPPGQTHQRTADGRKPDAQGPDYLSLPAADGQHGDFAPGAAARMAVPVASQPHRLRSQPSTTGLPKSCSFRHNTARRIWTQRIFIQAEFMPPLTGSVHLTHCDAVTIAARRVLTSANGRPGVNTGSGRHQQLRADVDVVQFSALRLRVTGPAGRSPGSTQKFKSSSFAEHR